MNKDTNSIIYEFGIETYKKLICEMIQEINDFRFVKQIYSIIYRQLYRRAEK